MDLLLRPYREEDLPAITALWNQVVEQGDSFPGDRPLSPGEAADMFAAQTDTIVACGDGEVVGLYILHPNNIGRCSQIANASYAVRRDRRGGGIGRRLVCDSLRRAKARGFAGMQYNAVVKSNTAAIALYLKLGFTVLGTVKNGYRLADGRLTDTLIFYYGLADGELPPP
ncbi:MAG TPA: GNAT family N-acetyltransferase [Firmicutes bacterium]|nr:GNAT family N-acetyltransferase [Bacillota bacterium]